jgi:6-phosphogluconolactonase
MLGLVLTILAAAVMLKTETIFVGTYTSPDGSRGIYRLQLDSNGKFGKPDLVAEVANPSYLALHGSRLFSVTEWGGPHDLTVFNVDSTGRLTKDFEGASGNGGPCHIAVSPDGTSAVISAYGGGTVTFFDLVSRSVRFKFQNEGSGPNRQRQEKSHLHFAAFAPNSKFVYACDLGTDEVLQFQMDAPEPKRYKIPDGGGARHLTFSADGTSLYVVNELTSAVTHFSRSKDGTLTRKATISTLKVANPANSGAAIKLHPSGKYLAVSNRGDNSLAVFRIGTDGSLSSFTSHPVPVRTPRDFSFSPDGNTVVVAGQSSNDLVSIKFNAESGAIEDVLDRAEIKQPVCVLFR